MKIDAKILLGRILQKMIDQGYSQVSGYNKFTYLGHAPNKLTIGREAGQDTDIGY